MAGPQPSRSFPLPVLLQGRKPGELPGAGRQALKRRWNAGRIAAPSLADGAFLAYASPGDRPLGQSAVPRGEEPCTLPLTKN